MAGRTAIWKLRGAPAAAPFLRVEIADTFWRRFCGLMGRSGIASAHALLLSPCSGVHMFFMRFAVDVVYLKRLADDGWRVSKVVRGLRPWIGCSACMEADAALELGRGEAEQLGLAPGSVWEEA